MAQAPATSPQNIPRSVASALGRLRRKITRWLILDGLARLTIAIVALLALDFAIDYFGRMDIPQRVVIAILVCGTLLFVLFRSLLRPLSVRVSDDSLCLEVESNHPELGQSLISAVQFSRLADRGSHGASPAMVEATIEQGVKQSDKVQFGQVMDHSRYLKNMATLFTTMAILGAFAWGVTANETLAAWYQRNVLLQDVSWPHDTYLVVENLTDGKLRIPRGDDWPIVVKNTNELDDLENLPAVYVDFDFENGGRTESMERREETRVFAILLEDVVEPFRFRVRCGRARTSWIPAELVDRPDVANLEIFAKRPEYADGKRQPLLTTNVAGDDTTQTVGSGPFSVLAGSLVEISGQATKPLSSAWLNIPAQEAEDGDKAIPAKKVPMKVDGEHFSINVEPNMFVGGRYYIDLADTEQIRLPGDKTAGPLHSRSSTRFTLNLQEDMAPQFWSERLRGVGRMVVPTAEIPLSSMVRDDFAVTAVRLNYSWQADASETVDAEGSETLDHLKDLYGKREFLVEHVFDLKPLKVTPGSGLRIYLLADDNDAVSGTNTGQSQPFLLRVVSEGELRAELLRREKEQRQEFARLAKVQDVLLTETEALLAETKEAGKLEPKQREKLMNLQKRQKLLGSNMSSIAKRLDDVIVELKNNKLEDPGGRLEQRLKEQVINPIKRLAEIRVPTAADALDQARQKADKKDPRNEEMEKAVEEQREINSEMQKILSHMKKSVDILEALNLTYEARKLEQELLERTRKAVKEQEQQLREKASGGGDGGADPDEDEADKPTETEKSGN